MSFFKSLHSFFHRSNRDGEIDEELRSHIQHRADDLERSGVSRVEAERRARVEFGGYVRFKEESREAMGGKFSETFVQDVRFGFRMLLKSPSFTFAAVLTLAFAIGANAVVFSILNAFILKPLNLPGAESLYTIERGQDRTPMQSYPDYVDLRDRNRSFAGLAAYEISTAGLDTGGNPTPAWLYEVSGNYFDTLGVKPHLGRFIHASDEHGPNSVPYIVLSYSYWQSRFHADPAAVGSTVLVNKHPFTVLGVAQPGFYGSELFYSPQFWAPSVDQEQIEGWNGLNSRGNRWIWLVGRLKSGITVPQATADLQSIATQLATAYPKEDGQISFTLARPGLAGDMLGGPVRAFVIALMLLAGLILMAACANLGSLFAARTADRSREIALRLALGSSRNRILRQLLTEAAMISLAGGVAGLTGGVMLLRWLSIWQPVPNFPINLPVNPDATVYLVSLLLAFASGLLFGLVPLRQVLRANPYQIVKSGSASSAGRRFVFRDLLLVIQITVCAVLVTSSMVAVRGLVRSLHSNFGFQPENAMVVDTDLDMAGYSGPRNAAMQQRIVDVMEAVPGATAVGLIDRAPLAMGWNSEVVFDDNATDFSVSKAAAEPMTYRISPGYPRAAGTALIAGRTFTLHDDAKAPRVAIVNREFARKLFRSEANAVGRFYRTLDGSRIQVVGMVEDGKYKTLTEDQEPAVFLPMLQAPTSATWVIVRSNRDPQIVAPAMEAALHKLDPGLPFTMRTWTKELDSALFASRVATVALGILGGLGAMLAITGIFGMASYSVSKRLRELGIRIAMGAQRREILWSALGRALRLLLVGSATGLLLGLAATRVLSYVVYQASPRDPVVLACAIVAMLLLGLVATWIPALRALSVDPLILLREE
jgi:predicted permease